MIKKAAVAAIRFYQRAISRNTQPHCNYVPTCSAYAIEAFEKYGFLRGFLLASWRLLRCNPFSRGGYDPVPEKFTFRREFKVYAKRK